MTKRAIVLVPGYNSGAQLDARDALVESLALHAEGFETKTSDPEGDDGLNYVNVTATDRSTKETTSIDVYEAYWWDLAPAWSGETPWERLKRGTMLIRYWLTGGLMVAVFRREPPARTMWALIACGIFMLLWYLIVLAMVFKAIEAGNFSAPDWLENLLSALGVWDLLVAGVSKLSATPVVVFLLALAGVGILEQTSNLGAFVRAYLQDNPVGEGHIGLRARSRERVLHVMDHVHSKDYDEVFVVAHSIGSAIAVDALAEYGTSLDKTTLVTFGSALAVLAQQDRVIEEEIEKFYAPGHRLKNWIDVVFAKDLMGGPVPVPHVKGGAKHQRHDTIFPESIVPRMPAGLSWNIARMHNGYFTSSDSIRLLAAPADRLPPKQGPRVDHPDAAIA